MHNNNKVKIVMQEKSKVEGSHVKGQPQGRWREGEGRVEFV